MNQKSPSVTKEAGTERLMLRTSSGTSQPIFKLTVTTGPDASKSIVVDGAAPTRLLVGTGPTCHWVLGDRAISRRHFAIGLRDGLLALEDVGSTNGTFVGALRIKDVLLAGGEEIGLASTRIRVERLVQQAEVEVPRAASFGRVVGASLAMRKLYPALSELAGSDVSVLIEGEPGTGKELVAEVIHEQSARAPNDLVVFDPRSAGERADRLLFGSSAAPGAIEQAFGGTLVLDEPSELSMALQVKLTWWLEGRAFVRDDRSAMPTGDVRIITLSRSDIEREVEGGRLREDLAARLGRARIELPPLRDREGDVTLLATTFFRALRLEDKVLAPLTIRRFEAYSWPANVRELKNAVIHFAMTGEDAADPQAAFRSESGEISPGELFQRVLAADLPLTKARDIVIEDFERRFVKLVLERHKGNVTRAAAASGLARRYFQTLRAKRGL